MITAPSRMIAVADDAIGDITAEQRRGIDHSRYAPYNLWPRFTARVACVKLGDDVKGERPTHAVERETLPELGHERIPVDRMAKHGGEFGVGVSDAATDWPLMLKTPCSIVVGPP